MLAHQLAFLTRDKGSLAHDDRLEALAMAVNYWTEQMDRDDKVAADRAQERLLDEELERYKEYMVVVGQDTQHDDGSWFEDW